MSAEQYGARLLSEVVELNLEEVSWRRKWFRSTPVRAALRSHRLPLQQVHQVITDVTKLLQDLRTRVDPSPKGLLGLKALDDLFELFRYHETSAASIRGPLQEHNSTSRYIDDASESEWFDSADNDNDASSKRAMARPPIVEITSPHSATGKTSLLYLLTSLALLNRDHGGKASAVVWLDTDGHFSATRLAQVMTNIISKHESTTTTISTDTLIHQALSHLHIIQPNSSSQLLSTLQKLSTYLLSPSTHSSMTRPLSLLILSSATAFQHQDRFTSEIARLNAGSTSHTTTSPSLTSQVQSSLLSLHTRFASTILFTTTTLPTPRTPRPSTTPTHIAPDEQAGISTWTAFATLSLITSRTPVPPFAPNMSLEQCLGDREKRQEAVKKGRFVVSVDWRGSGRWNAAVRERLGKMEGEGRFGVRVCEGGVEVDGTWVS